MANQWLIEEVITVHKLMLRGIIFGKVDYKEVAEVIAKYKENQNDK